MEETVEVFVPWNQSLGPVCRRTDVLPYCLLRLRPYFHSPLFSPPWQSPLEPAAENEPQARVRSTANFPPRETCHGSARKPVSTRSDGALILLGSHNLLEHATGSQAERTPRWSPPDCAMAVMGLVIVGLFGCGFMLYVLFQWIEETLRKD